MTRALVRIGGAAGAWGDSPMAIGQLLGAEIDYLMMDYLAEVTMSLLARARIKDAQAGYPPDFIGYLKPHLQEIKRRGIRVVSNAGGVNPRACKLALETAGAALGLDLRVARSRLPPLAQPCPARIPLRFLSSPAFIFAGFRLLFGR